MGEPCFAERARWRASAADVIVVNTHLYGLHVGSDGAILPEHDVVVFDEAHVVEDVMSDTVGIQLAPGRFVTLAGVVRRIVDDPALLAGVVDLADELRDAIGPFAGQRLPVPYPDSVQDALAEARLRLDRVLAALIAVDPPLEDARQRKLRAQLVTGRAIAQLDFALADHDGLRGLRLRLAGAAATRDRAPRRRPDPRRTGVGRTHRRADERDDPDVAAGPGRAPGREGRRRRRRQPVRLRPASAPLLRPARARSPGRRLSRRRPRRAGRPDHRRRGSHAGVVHELEGDGPRRRGGAGATGRADPDPARPAQAGARRPLRPRRGHVRVRHGRVLPGRRRARSHLEPGRRRPASRSPARTTRCCRPVGSCSAPPPSARSTFPGRRCSSPRRPAASSAIPRTVVWSPSWIAGSERPATAGTSCAPCHRCAARGIGRRSRSSSGRSPRDRSVASRVSPAHDPRPGRPRPAARAALHVASRTARTAPTQAATPAAGSSAHALTGGATAGCVAAGVLVAITVAGIVTVRSVTRPDFDGVVAADEVAQRRRTAALGSRRDGAVGTRAGHDTCAASPTAPCR